MTFEQPPSWKNVDGNDRKVGFEFEFAGVDTKNCAELIAELFGGKISWNHSLEAEISNTEAGTFKVKLDAQPVTKLVAKLESDSVINNRKLREDLSTWIGDAAGKIVPFEIVTPPMTFEQFPMLETLREKLQQRDAAGTKSAIIYAFGMHINPEISSEKVEDTRDILRAFLILYDWLQQVMKVDLTRRALSYIDPFPTDYVKKILSNDYTPDWDTFIADYIEYNPTRNRALDLLPLFAHLKPDSLKLLKETDRKLVKARPAFHYRLPNCEIDKPNWRIARDWNYWVEIEKLANNKDTLSKVSEEYLLFIDKPLHMLSNNWGQQISKQFGYAAL